MSAMKILIIEDDAPIRAGIAGALGFHGYRTAESDGGAGALATALQGGYDLLLLDLVLPAAHGLEILREVRKSWPAIPVIILTACGEEADRVEGLRRGADDYVVKPFSVKELLARVEAVLRRSPERPVAAEVVQFAGGEVETASGKIRFAGGGEGRLSATEAELLRYLAMHAGRPVSREEITGRLWHHPAGSLETRTVDMHVARLREKLGDDPGAPRVIETVRGRGYRFLAPEAP